MILAFWKVILADFSTSLLFFWHAKIVLKSAKKILAFPPLYEIVYSGWGKKNFFYKILKLRQSCRISCKRCATASHCPISFQNFNNLNRLQVSEFKSVTDLGGSPNLGSAALIWARQPKFGLDCPNLGSTAQISDRQPKSRFGIAW